METQEQILRFKKFIEAIYHAVLLENCRKGMLYLDIDFSELSKFDLELAEELIESDDADEIIKAAKIAVEQFDIEGVRKKFQILVSKLPSTSYMRIREIRCENVGKIMNIEGVIRSKSTVNPVVIDSRFECPSCGNIIPIIQNDQKYKQPKLCACGRRGKFKKLKDTKIDMQKIELEELPENIKGNSQPSKLRVKLFEWLVDRDFEPKFNPGAKVSIVGILKDYQKVLRNGVESTESDYVFEALSIENIEEEEVDLNLTDDDIKKIDEIAQSKNPVEILKQSLAPSIYGRDKIKEGILLQLVGGTRKVKHDGTVTRGDIHILIIGDPGCGKSKLIQRIEKIIPYARTANGKGASGVGLTASVVKDDFVGWTFQAGTLVLAHKNIALIDEFDKMSKEDRDQIHEALEQQTVTIAKAGVQARLRCECSLLAGANPKLGRFDNHMEVIEQIMLPPTLINRFDMIFAIKDTPDPKKDEELTDHVLPYEKNNEQKAQENKIYDTSFVRKYLFTAKKLKPIHSNGSLDKIKNYYLKMRSKYQSEGDNVKSSIPISARQLEGLVRMSEAFAKLRMSKTVSTMDAKKAINLMEEIFKKISKDEKGNVDFDKIDTGTGSTERNAIIIVKNVIRSIEDENGKNQKIETIFEKCKEKGISEEEFEKAIKKLKKIGDVFEVKNGYISTI